MTTAQRMPGLLQRVRQAVSRPPAETVLALVRRKVTGAKAAKLRRRDAIEPTFGRIVPEQLVRLLGQRFALPRSVDSETTDELVTQCTEHRFDLLGSGPAAVRHGTSCAGIEGIVFAPCAAVAVDPEGRWLRNRVSAANAEECARIWALVDSGYTPIDWQLDFKSGFRWDERKWFLDIDPAGAPRGADIKLP